MQEPVKGMPICDAVKNWERMGGGMYITGFALGILIGAPLGFFLSSLIESGRTETE
jgi:hypothetical protein